MTKDLTTGKIMPILVNFTVPLVLGNLFQLTYNAVDSIIVGHFVGQYVDDTISERIVYGSQYPDGDSVWSERL